MSPAEWLVFIILGLIASAILISVSVGLMNVFNFLDAKILGIHHDQPRPEVIEVDGQKIYHAADGSYTAERPAGLKQGQAVVTHPGVEWQMRQYNDGGWRNPDGQRKLTAAEWAAEWNKNK